MTRNVWIKVSGYHEVDGEAQEPVVTECRGIYNTQGGKHYLRYAEVGETLQAQVNCRVKFYDGYLEVVKKGAISSKMIFDAGKEVMTRYETPVGAIEVGVEASNVCVIEAQRRITVTADYALHAGGQCVQNSRVEIVVIPFPIV